MPGLELPGFRLPGFELPGFELPGFDPPDFAAPGFDEPAFDEPGSEEPGLDGHIVYYSLDGFAWNKIDALSGVGTPGKLTANVPVTNWAFAAS